MIFQQKIPLIPHRSFSNYTRVSWLIGFYPQGSRKGIFVSSKAHVSPPTHILSDRGDPPVVRPGSRTQVTCTEGDMPNCCPTNLTLSMHGDWCHCLVESNYWLACSCAACSCISARWHLWSWTSVTNYLRVPCHLWQLSVYIPWWTKLAWHLRVHGHKGCRSLW